MNIKPRRIITGALLVAVAAVVFYAAPPQPTRVIAVPASSATASAWDRPQLVNPVTITLTDANRNLQLSAGQDYDITCQNPASLSYGPSIAGGHNIVLHDCNLVVANAGGGASFKNQTGTIWVNDVHLSGTQLMEGIDLQEPGDTTVVLRNVLVDELHGSQNTNHADCIQTWSGPARLLVDGFTCTTDYQGFFLLPNQNGGSVGTVERIWDFRHVDLSATGGYSGWLGWIGADGHSTVDWHLEHVYVAGPGEPRSNPGSQWVDVLPGTPPGGHYVTAASFGAVGPDEPGSSRGASGAGVNPAAFIGEQ